MNILQLGTSYEEIGFVVKMYSLPHIAKTIDDRDRNFLGMLRLVDKLRCDLARLYVVITDGQPVGIVGGYVAQEGLLMAQVAVIRKVDPQDTIEAALQAEQKLVAAYDIHRIQAKVPCFNRASRQFCLHYGMKDIRIDPLSFLRDGTLVHSWIMEKEVQHA